MWYSLVRRTILATAGAVVAALVMDAGAGGPLSAQERPRLQGVVADEETLELIPGATVSVVGTELEARTAADGTFAFPYAPVGPVSVRVEAAGYPAVIEEAVVSRDVVLFLQIVLPRVDAVLGELLVFGTRSQETGLVDSRTAADLLAREVPDLAKSQGNLGMSDRPVRLRGTGTIEGTGEPIVFLDGVRIGTARGAVDALSRIPATDVRSIRVLRGPSAAFLQGSADGAIYIETRSGSGGTPE